MPQFDAQAARQAGYTNQEILAHLAESRKFDLEGARRSGYSDDEILTHLSGAPAAPAGLEPSPRTVWEAEEAATERGFLEPKPGEGAIRRYHKGGARAALGLLRMPYDIVAASFPRTLGEAGLAGITGGLGLITKHMLVEPQIEMARRARQAAEAGHGSESLGYSVAAGIPMLGPLAAGIGERAGTGDVAGALGEAAVYAAAPTVTKGAAPAVRTAAVKVAPAVGRMARTVARVVPGMPTKLLGAEDAMTRAVRPLASNTGWEASITKAMPDLKAAEQRSGIQVRANADRPVETLDRTVDLLNEAKQHIWAEYEPKLQAGARATIDGDAVANAMEASIDPYTLRHDPAAVKAIREKAENYRSGGSITLPEAESYLHSMNKRDATFYAKNKVSRRQATGDPIVAAELAEADAVRGELYGALDRLTGPGARELKARYGALLNVEKELYRRRNVLARQAPESLSEQLSGWYGLGAVVRGVGAIARGDVAGGVGEIARGVAGRVAARYIKRINETDSLIEQAFRKSKALLGGPGNAPPPAPPAVPPGGPGGPIPPPIVSRPRGGAPPLATPPGVAMPPAPAIPAVSSAPPVPATAPEVTTVPGLPGQLAGMETTLRTPIGPFRARYRIVEADQLHSSHNPLNFTKNPNYPEGIQERAYHRNKNAQADVSRIGRELAPELMVNNDPTAVNGPPQSTPAGVVLGGNGRVMALRRAYAEGPGGVRYKQYLIENAAQFGMDPLAVARMRQPVLDRMVLDAPEEPAGLARTASAFNRNFTKKMSEIEAAVSAGKNLSFESAQELAARLGNLGEEASLRKLMEREPLVFRDMLLRDGVLREADLPEFFTEAGALNDAGKSFLENAVLGSVIPDTGLLGSMPAQVRAKLERSLSSLVELGGRTDAWNLLPDLEESVRAATSANARSLKLEDFLAQDSLFGSKLSPRVQVLARTLVEKPTEVARRFRQYASDARQDVPGQAAMFAKPDPMEAFRAAFSESKAAPATQPGAGFAEKRTAGSGRRLDFERWLTERKGIEPKQFRGLTAEQQAGLRGDYIRDTGWQLKIGVAPEARAALPSEPPATGGEFSLQTEAVRARQRIKARRGRLLSGIPADDLADYAVIGASKIAQGLKNFGKWAEAMVEELGERVRPHLAQLYRDAERLAEGAPQKGLPGQRDLLIPGMGRAVHEQEQTREGLRPRRKTERPELPLFRERTALPKSPAEEFESDAQDKLLELAEIRQGMVEIGAAAGMKPSERQRALAALKVRYLGLLQERAA